MPYADYVNVSISNRGQPWLNVKNNYTVDRPGSCWMETTKKVCKAVTKKSCTRFVDGIPEIYDCSVWQCVETPIPAQKKCSPATQTQYLWFGCVGSRTVNDLNLTDAQPQKPYPGILARPRTASTKSCR